MNRETGPARTRVARCTCGGLRVTAVGEPESVYACACLECQRATGSAFSWRARYRKQALERIEGESRSWRRGSDSGRWVEQVFCPACGTLVYMNAESIPGEVVISVGCFTGPDFAPPRRLFRGGRRHSWYELAGNVEVVP